MSAVRRLQSELQLWKHAWQLIESFLDRIDEQREQDEEHAVASRGLVRALAAIEEVRRLHDGTGLRAPIEIAEKGSPGVDFKRELTLSTRAIDSTDKAPDVDPAAKTRLPGAYDVELAVASLLVTTVADGDGFKLVPLKSANLQATKDLFRHFDAKAKAWIDVVLPSYDFGAVINTAVNVDITKSDAALFTIDQRRSAATYGYAVPGVSAPSTWSSLRSARQGHREAGASLTALLALIGGDATARDRAHAAATAAEAACTRGGAALAQAAKDLANEDLGDALDVAKISAAATAMSARSAKYGAIKGALAGTTALQLSKLITDLGALTEDGATAALYVLLAAALDEAIAARIAYPDGPLRLLRTMELSFKQHWDSRVVWFESRKDRYLDRLLVSRFLGPFVKSLRHVYAGQGTELGLSATLDPLAPAPLASTHLQLAKSVPPHDLSTIVPGQLAVIEGPRRALALLLGDDSRLGRRGAAPTPELLQRLKTTPLAVSLARGRAPSDVPGMLVSGTVGSGPITIGDDGLRRGGFAATPEHDGVVQALVALWSRLCLLLGTASVAASLAGARTGFTGHLPSHLGETIRLAVVGAVNPHDNKLILAVSALPTDLHPDAAARPIVARPGELLLVAGKDEEGNLWQGVVDVLAIVRTSKPDEDPLIPPLGNLVCCDPPGDYLVILVKDTPFPVALTSVVVHRDFRGFGSPSLATGVLLPPAIDPSAETKGDGTDVFRGPELDAAGAVLSSWMWQRA